MREPAPVSLKVGVQIPNFGLSASADGLRDAVDAVMDAGLDGIWVSDHVVLVDDPSSSYPYSHDGAYVIPADADWFEALVTLGHLAARSGDLELGTSVCVVPQRQPVLLAKQLATIDRLATGPVLFGVGVGWFKEEFTALGADFEHRGGYTDDALRVIRACWTGAPTSGSYGPYELPPGVRSHPVPRDGGLPVLVGGNSEPALRRAAMFGDGWFGAVPAAGMSPQEFARKRDHIRELKRSSGQDPDGFSFSLRIALSRSGLTSSDTLDLVDGYVEAGLDRLTVDLSWRNAAATKAALGDLAALRDELIATSDRRHIDRTKR